MLTAERNPIRCPHCGKIAATVTLAEKTESVVMPLTTAEILSQPIDIHKWPTRICHAFQTHRRLIETENGKFEYVDAPIKTFADLCEIPRYVLMRSPNIGAGSLDYVEEVLANYGLHLSERERETC